MRTVKERWRWPLLLSGLSVVCLLFLACRGDSAAPGTNASATLNTARRGVEQTWVESHFVLGRITDADHLTDRENTRQIILHVTVIYDNRVGLEGRQIRVGGPEYGANAMMAGSWQMPDLTIGDSAVFRLSPTEQADLFDASPGGGITLPVGLATGVAVEPEKVEQVHEALRRAGDYFARKDPAKVHDDAVLLLKSKQYYLWALGACLLSLEGTEEDVQRLQAAMWEETCTPDMALWLDDQLLAVPGWDKKRADYLQSYLWKHSARRFGPPP